MSKAAKYTQKMADNSKKILISGQKAILNPEEQIGYDTNLFQVDQAGASALSSPTSTGDNHELEQTNEMVEGLGVLKANTLLKMIPLADITPIDPAVSPAPGALALNHGYYFTDNGSVTVAGIIWDVNMGNLLCRTTYGYNLIENMQSWKSGDIGNPDNNNVVIAIDSEGNIVANPLRLGSYPGQKLAFWGTAGVTQLAAPTGYPLSGAATLSQVITTLNDTIAKLRSLGIFA